MTQHQRILKYLETNESISPMEAFSELGITKLATRISELKKAGYSFDQELIHGKDRFGKPMVYMRYAMEGRYGSYQS